MNIQLYENFIKKITKLKKIIPQVKSTIKPNIKKLKRTGQIITNELLHKSSKNYLNNKRMINKVERYLNNKSSVEKLKELLSPESKVLDTSTKNQLRAALHNIDMSTQEGRNKLKYIINKYKSDRPTIKKANIDNNLKNIYRNRKQRRKDEKMLAIKGSLLTGGLAGSSYAANKLKERKENKKFWES